MVINLIGITKTRSGLALKATLDKRNHEKGKKHERGEFRCGTYHCEKTLFFRISTGNEVARPAHYPQVNKQ
jgi:hypothetical protein